MSLKPKQIAASIKQLSGVNLFENTRKRPVVEMRSLLCYLLRDKLKMRWTNIALFFKSQGKEINHATVIYSRNMYKVYKKSNKQLEEIEKTFYFKSSLSIDEIDRVHYLENKCRNLQGQVNKLKEKLKRTVIFPEQKLSVAEKTLLQDTPRHLRKYP